MITTSNQLIFAEVEFNSGRYLLKKPLRRDKYPPLFTDTEANNILPQHKCNTNSQVVILFSDDMGFARHF